MALKENSGGMVQDQSPASVGPQLKRSRTDSFWDDWNGMDAESSTTETTDVQVSGSSDEAISQDQIELCEFFTMPNLPISEDPLLWWKVHSVQFPHLSKLAANYLAIPPTSADSERHFSASGNIVTPTRCSLDPEKVKMLVFLKLNN